MSAATNLPARATEKRLQILRWLLPLAWAMILLSIELYEHFVLRRAGIGPELTLLLVLFLYGVPLPILAFLAASWFLREWRLRRQDAETLQRLYSEASQVREELARLSAERSRLLRRSEERYAQARRAVHIGSWDWDIQSGDVSWSEQIWPILGLDSAEVAASYEAFSSSVHPEDRQNVAAAIDASLQEGADYAIEHRIVWPDGTVRWIAESGDVVRDASGNALEMFGLVQDITERKQVEEQIRQQHTFLTSVIESLTHPFYVVRVDDYTIEVANRAARLGGLPGTDTCYALTHGWDEPCRGDEHVCPIDEIVRTKRPVIVEHVHHDLKGDLRNVEVRGYPLLDGEGNVSRAIMYALDVTQRKRAEEALRESEARWRSVTENSPDYVILLDAELRIRFLNYASPGLTVDGLIGTPLWTLVSKERQLEIKQILESVLETGRPRSYQTEFAAPDRSTIYYESRAVARRLDDQIVGVTVNARDITEHIRVERALLEASEAAEQARREEHERRQEADRRRRIAEGLAGVLVALNSGQPLKQILDQIAAQANELLDTQTVAIYQMQEETGTLAVQAATGLLSHCLPSEGSPLGVEALQLAVTSRQTIAIPDLAADPIYWPDIEHAGPFHALLAVPILIQDQVYGGILLYDTHPRSFSDEELELSAIFGDQVALALENAQLRERIQQAAVAAERTRLAHDLHDSVTQALFSASLVAEVLPQVWRRDPEEAWQGIEELRVLSRSALAEMRTLLLELRPTTLVETKLHVLIAQLVEVTIGRRQLSVALDVQPSPELPPPVHITFYRIAQEALHNVIKHSDASHISVSLRASPPVSTLPGEDWQGQVTLCVSDDGRGFDQGQVGPEQLGLSIMRERAAAMGGRLNITSQPGQGTQVWLDWGSRLL